MGLSTAGAMVGLEALLRDMEANVQPDAPEVDDADESPKTELVAEGDQSLVTVDASETPVAKPKRVRKPKKVVEAEKVDATVEAATPKPKRARKPKVEAPVVETVQTENLAATEPTSQKDPTDNVVIQEPTKPVEKAKRVFFGRNRIGRLEARLGTDLGKMLVFNTEDAELEGEALAAKVAENRAAFKTWAQKVQMRATNVIEFASGKSTKLNTVIGMVLRMLAKDRTVTMGANGNLFKLLSASYQPDSARAMGASTMGALEALQIVTKSGAHAFVPNENSTFLAVLSDKLLLSFVDVEETVNAVVAAEAQALAAIEAAKTVTPTVVSPVDPSETPELEASQV